MGVDFKFRSIKDKDQKTEVLKNYILENYPDADISKVEYTKYKDKITIGCNIHGDFKIDLGKLLDRKQFCRKCTFIKAGKSKTLREKVKRIEKFKEFYDSIYDIPENIHDLKAKDLVPLECKEHGHFKRSLYDLMRNKHCQKCCIRRGCKNNGCGKTIFDRAYNKDKSMFYIIELEGNGERFIKIGITNNFEKRFVNRLPYKIKSRLKFYTGKHIYFLEKIVKNYINEHRRELKYKPLLKFGGYTECYKQREFVMFLKECRDDFVSRGGWDDFSEFKD